MGVKPFLSVGLIYSNTEEQLTDWTSSAILISGSDLLKHWRATHTLDECSAILVSGFNALKQTLESNSHSG